MPDEKTTCANCEQDCTQHHFMCDEDDGVWCPECWDKTACAQGVHGEGCPTQVFGEPTPPDTRSPEQQMADRDRELSRKSSHP